MGRFLNFSSPSYRVEWDQSTVFDLASISSCVKSSTGCQTPTKFMKINKFRKVYK